MFSPQKLQHGVIRGARCAIYWSPFPDQKYYIMIEDIMFPFGTHRCHSYVMNSYKRKHADIYMKQSGILNIHSYIIVCIKLAAQCFTAIWVLLIVQLLHLQSVVVFAGNVTYIQSTTSTGYCLTKELCRCCNI